MAAAAASSGGEEAKTGATLSRPGNDAMPPVPELTASHAQPVAVRCAMDDDIEYAGGACAALCHVSAVAAAAAPPLLCSRHARDSHRPHAPAVPRSLRRWRTVIGDGRWRSGHRPSHTRAATVRHAQVPRLCGVAAADDSVMCWHGVTRMGGAPRYVLLTHAQIQKRLEELGAAISRDYAGLNPLVVGVLTGAIMVVADLVRHITVPCELDFLAASSCVPPPLARSTLACVLPRPCPHATPLRAWLTTLAALRGCGRRYGMATTSCGVITIVKDIKGDPRGRHIIIVEDLVDTGTWVRGYVWATVHRVRRLRARPV